MRSALRSHIRRRLALSASIVALVVAASACTGAGSSASGPTTSGRSTPSPSHRASTTPPTKRTTSVPRTTEPAGQFTMAFAGDVHFSGRVRPRLDHNPATVFGPAAAALSKADLTMVNLETAVTTGGVQQAKEFTFRTPPSAFTALKDAGIDVATMANNHGADYGMPGIRDSLAAIASSHFPVVGIGADAAHAYAPYTTTLNGVRVAILAADQVQDETTLRLFSAGPHTPGVANAFSDRLLSAVRQAKAAGYVVVVYIHWGIEYTTCPSSNQRQLAAALADAGAAAVIGTHAHVLQGAGWRSDGTYVEYGLGNYLWWMSFGNNQDDNGVLTLTFRAGRVVSNAFAPAHLDSRGVPMPATGSEGARIAAEWNGDRSCAGLSARPPA